MAGTDLNQKYTIDKYCSRFEVAKILGTNLIDPLWNQILAFRKLHSMPLPFANALGVKYTITNLESISAKAGSINDKISSYIVGYGKLGSSPIAKATLTSEMLKIALKNIATRNKIDVSEITLQKLVRHEPTDGEYSLLKNYLRALEKLYSNPFEPLNENFLAEYYAILKGQEDNLIFFYRNVDNETVASKALVDREYDNGVPSKLIINMIDNFSQYISNTENSIVCRLAATFYMFNYIKPFSDLNTELACIVAKRIIASTEVESSAIYIPLESVINSHEFYSEVFKETQKTNDFTYVYIKGAELIDNALLAVLDRMVQVNAHVLDSVNKMGDDPVQIKKEFGIDVPKEPTITKKEEPFEYEPRVKVETKVVEESNSLSEKELKAMENDMLESDPFIKKGQAHFYVRHCTKGKYYTIQQYKKCEGCVYETARTSMDNLSLRGYYRRENVKNKFVYTPIDKE